MMKVDLDPFEVNSSFAEPMYLSINMVDVKERLDLSTQPEMAKTDPKPILV